MRKLANTAGSGPRASAVIAFYTSGAVPLLQIVRHTSPSIET
jgi:hypothetical protein